MAAKIKILKPIWDGGDHQRKVGVAEFRMTSGILEINIDYREADGKKTWKKPLYICKELAMKCPVQVVKGTRLRVIPIVDLTEDIEEAREVREQLYK